MCQYQPSIPEHVESVLVGDGCKVSELVWVFFTKGQCLISC